MPQQRAIARLRVVLWGSPMSVGRRTRMRCKAEFCYSNGERRSQLGRKAQAEGECSIVHRLDTVALLHTCFPCFQTCQTHLSVLPTHSRWLKVCHETELHSTLSFSFTLVRRPTCISCVRVAEARRLDMSGVTSWLCWFLRFLRQGFVLVFVWFRLVFISLFRPSGRGYPSTWTTSVDACRASDAHNCAMVQSQWEPGRAPLWACLEIYSATHSQSFVVGVSGLRGDVKLCFLSVQCLLELVWVRVAVTLCSCAKLVFFGHFFTSCFRLWCGQSLVALRAPMLCYLSSSTSPGHLCCAVLGDGLMMLRIPCVATFVHCRARLFGMVLR